jgi:hypothetical protein
MSDREHLPPRAWRTIDITAASDDPAELDDILDQLADVAFTWASHADPTAAVNHREAHVSARNGIPDWVVEP